MKYRLKIPIQMIKQAPWREYRIPPPKLAIWMVKHSLREKVRLDGIAAFENEYHEKYWKSDDKPGVQNWALRTGWERLSQAYQPIIEIIKFILTVLGIVLAIIGIFIA